MRILLGIMVLLTQFFAAGYADGAGELRNERVKNPLLVKVLNSGEILNLNDLASAKISRRQLAIRLISIGIAGTCIPDTHMICSYSYYLAVSEYDEAPNQAVYDLGTIGEITKVEWLQDNRIDCARLKIEVSNYPTYAFARNPNLVLKVSTYELDVSVNFLKIKTVK